MNDDNFSGISSGDSENTIATYKTATNSIARTDTAYVVEHYFEDLSGTYVIDNSKTENLTGTTASAANATYLSEDITGFSSNLSHESTISSGTIVGNGSLVLRLYYSRNTYTLSYNANSGTVSGGTAAGTIKFGAEVTLPTTHNRNNYTFTYYTNNANVDTSDLTFTMPASDITVSANWVMTYSIKINGDGTEYLLSSSNNDFVRNSVPVTTGDIITFYHDGNVINPTAANENTNNIYNSSSGSLSGKVIIGGNVTVTLYSGTSSYEVSGYSDYSNYIVVKQGESSKPTQYTLQTNSGDKSKLQVNLSNGTIYLAYQRKALQFGDTSNKTYTISSGTMDRIVYVNGSSQVYVSDVNTTYTVNFENVASSIISNSDSVWIWAWTSGTNGHWHKATVTNGTKLTFKSVSSVAGIRIAKFTNDSTVNSHRHEMGGYDTMVSPNDINISSTTGNIIGYQGKLYNSIQFTITMNNWESGVWNYGLWAWINGQDGVFFKGNRDGTSKKVTLNIPDAITHYIVFKVYDNNNYHSTWPGDENKLTGNVTRGSGTSYHINN